MLLLKSNVTIRNSIFENIQIDLVSLTTAFHFTSSQTTNFIALENTIFNNITWLNTYCDDFNGMSVFYVGDSIEFNLRNIKIKSLNVSPFCNYIN